MENDDSEQQIGQQARRLEGLLSSKLAAYAKLASNREGSSISSIPASSSSSSSSEYLEKMDSAAKEVEALLAQLTQVVERMPNSNSYSLNRYQSVLSDFSQEYRLMRSSTRDARLELLSGANSSSDNGGGSTNSEGIRTRTEPLFREQKGLSRSLAGTDEVITIAQHASSALKKQKATFTRAMDKLSLLAAKYPQINGVMQSIRRHRQRDVIVMAIVIAGCMCFTFVYVLLR